MADFLPSNFGMIPSKITVTLCLLLLNYLSAIGQILHFETHWLSSALPSSETYGVYQDRRGYLWVQTEVGLCRSNGRTFQWLEPASGAKDFGIYALTESRDGRIWLSTSDGRIGYVNGDTIQFLSVSFPLVLKSEHPYFYQIAEEEGNIWAVWADGLVVLDIQKPGIKKILLNRMPQMGLVPGILKTKNSYLPANITPNVQKKGICSELKYYSNLNNSIRVKLPMNIKIDDWRILAHKYNNGALLSIGSYLLFVQEEVITKVLKFSSRIIAIHCEQEGGIWIGLAKDGLRYFPDGNLDGEPVTGLKGLSVSGICLDKEQGVWASTLEKGLFRCQNPKVRRFTEPTLTERIFRLQAIENQVFSGGKSSFFFCHSNNRVKQIKLSSFDRENYFTSLIKTKEGYIVAGKGHLYHVDKNFKSINLFLVSGRPYKNAIDGLFRSTDGQTCGFYNRAIFRVGKRSVESIPNKSQYNIRSALLWPDGKIRVGTEKGVFCLENDTLYRESFLSRLSNMFINYQFVDAFNRVWICTKGFGIWSWYGNKLRSIRHEDGLSSDICLQASNDKYNRIWIATNNGLNCVSNPLVKTQKIKVYGTEIGLPSREITQVQCQDSLLFAGTNEGLVTIPILLTQDTLANIPVWLVSKKAEGSWPESDKLSSSQSDVSFHIDVPGFCCNGPVNYYYRLKGYHSNILSGSSGEIRYPKLPPGDFVLEVWSRSPVTMVKPNLEISFQILPPFYQKWWFLMLSFIAICALIWLIIRKSMEAYRKKSDQKLRINRMLNAYQLSALQAQMKPHFIFNAINSIQQFVLTNQPESAYRYLTRFSQLIRKVLHQSSQVSHSLTKELDIIKLYVELEQLRFQNRFEFLIDEDPNIETDSIHVPPLLLQPFVENAIWHGLMPLSHDVIGHITITINQIDDKIQIQIADNGVGRSAAALHAKEGHHSTGMSLTERRLHLQNTLNTNQIWSFDVSDRSGGGTIVSLRMRSAAPS